MQIYKSSPESARNGYDNRCQMLDSAQHLLGVAFLTYTVPEEVKIEPAIAPATPKRQEVVDSHEYSLVEQTSTGKDQVVAEGTAPDTLAAAQLEQLAREKLRDIFPEEETSV